MLGLARTSSSPTVPSSEHSEPASPNPNQDRTSIKPSYLPLVESADAEDDQKTEVDETERLVMEEPEPLELREDADSPSNVPEPKGKGQLTLDIPPSCSAVSSPASTFRRDRSPAMPPLLEHATGDEDALKEMGENQITHRHSRDPHSSKSSTKGVWLCSGPPGSGPSSPIDENGHGRRSICRPLVVRAMSTGRLAREFDEEGRVVSLSTHNERVLSGRAVASSPTTMKGGEDLRRTVSVANALSSPTRAGIIRSQTANNVSSPAPSRRKSVEAGFRRLENIGSWNKTAARE